MIYRRDYKNSVSYWIGGSKTKRGIVRKLVGNIYSTRSAFVHNGENSTKLLDIEAAIELTREVILKAISAL